VRRCGLNASGSGQGLLVSSYEHDTFGFSKTAGNFWIS